MDTNASIREAYEHERRQQRVTESRIGCVVALVLVPAGITLDFVVYPERFSEFLTLRLICDLVVGVVFALHFTRRAADRVPVLTFAWLIAVQGMICYMIFLTDGYQSTYYAGLNLAMLAVGILLPTTVYEAATFCLATVGLYVISGMANPTPVESPVFFNNMYFLLLTAVISVTAVFFSTRRRFSEFRLSFQLDERNRELARMDRLKSEFFANVSHELRTPLTLILAPVEDLLQRRDTLPEPLPERLEIIRGNALRLLNLVNDLLDVIRLEEGGVTLERRPLSLATILDAVVTSVRPLATSRDLDLTLSLPEAMPVTRGDRRALEKVFFNLLGNAAKFTPEGGRIDVDVRQVGEDLRVRVSDTGIGIAAEDLPFIFDRFRQADSSSTRKYAGTGIGLALVKELTESHGGSVSARSQPGKGTTIEVRLPVSTEAPTEAPEDDALQPDAGAMIPPPLPAGAPAPATVTTETVPAPAEAQVDTDVGDSPGNATLLVVDDEPDMRRYLVDLLCAEYQVLQARDGAEGLAIARREHPDLMVLDLMLPEIDGLEVCRRLKAADDTRRVRIVLLTARADESAKLTALENGADDFLTKPFSGLEVRTRLRNLLRAAQLEADLQHRHDDLETTLTALRETQNRLIHSEKLNALGRLSAGLLHEVNNPLNYTLTALELAKADPAVANDEMLADTLSDIDEGMQRIRGIVTELRAFAYPSRGQQQPVSLGELVQTALQLTQHDNHDVTIHDEVDADAMVLASRNHIVQVLVNLLTNAAKAVRAAAPERHGEIRLLSDTGGDRPRLTVHDTGTGIDEAQLDQIFDPFFTTRDVGEGMGMGLSVCQTIIRNHGGELTVASEAGAWTAFTFDLPADGASVASESDHTAQEAP